MYTKRVDKNTPKNRLPQDGHSTGSVYLPRVFFLEGVASNEARHLTILVRVGMLTPSQMKIHSTDTIAIQTIHRKLNQQTKNIRIVVHHRVCRTYVCVVVESTLTDRAQRYVGQHEKFQNLARQIDIRLERYMAYQTLARESTIINL
jgi:hypothetical protein